MEDNRKLIKTQARILLSFILITPTVLIICFIVMIVNKPQPGEVILKNGIKEVFIGKIDSIYRDKPNHNIKVVMAGKQRFELYPNWENEVELGDSLSKLDGSLKVNVYKKNGDYIILDYHDVFRKDQ